MNGLSVSYLYNSRGQRAVKYSLLDTIHYHYSQGGYLLAETTKNGELVREYIYIEGRPVAYVTKASKINVDSVIVDNRDDTVEKTGVWLPFWGNQYGQDYEYASSGDGSATFTWYPNVERAGRYEVYARWNSTSLHASNAPFSISHVGGQSIVLADQTKDAGQWVKLGSFIFEQGATEVTLTNQANGVVIADAIQLRYVDPRPQKSGLWYIHTDHLGTPLKVTDSNQQLVWSASYQPFGKAQVSESSVSLNFRFLGQYFDAETDSHYNYFRDYDPSVGRYIQSDPIGLAGGLNTYAYVSDNPINLIDPFGLKEYSDNFVGPLPPDGYRTSEMTQTKCGNIPPAPPGAYVNVNMSIAKNERNPLWFYYQVQGKSPWDYKQQGRMYEDFGNFNFGAAGNAFGLPLNVLQRGAGWANQKADPTRTNLGSPWGGYPYGDDPNDQEQIERGSNYCDCMGY